MNGSAVSRGPALGRGGNAIALNAILLSSLQKIAETLPERCTTAQLMFFLTAAMHDLNDSPTTLTELREEVGPHVSRSLHTTYKVFLDGPRKRSDYECTTRGLGWLTAEADPKDGRRKLLRLTEQGRHVFCEAFA
ncbi:hypothetical protein [Novosphingobium panipatense]|uniref:Winged helix DNA-binding protein n=1 Tax=Novosphingobium panipatense TaxID=428991 RepID=A0ABY1Q0V9_9SPHN|nr:hypothetical protein [Novosphingobium panipatense]SMP52993.1 hypothetical protein SAMN06296065_101351 [Novosphingobium panipatense]